MATQAEFAQKRKLQQEMWAKLLTQPSTFKAGDPPANAWAPVIAGFKLQHAGNKLEGQEKEGLKKYQDTLANALSPQVTPGQTEEGPLPEAGMGPGSPITGPSTTREKTPREMAEILMQNPDTASFGSQLLLKGMDRQESAKQREHEMGLNNTFRSNESALNRQNMRDIAEMNNQGRRDIAEGKAGKLPVGALKLQQEELDALSIASTIDSDIGALGKQLESGEIQLGPMENVMSGAKNWLGASDKTSKNYATLKASLEKMRNDSLRLNKGVQTEGDATRAWNELFQNLNDPGVVKQRLGEIQKVNQRAATFRKMNVDAIRKNYGLEQMDTKGYQNQQPAVGGLSSDEQSELDQLRKRFGK